jgi:uncharacterized protein
VIASVAQLLVYPIKSLRGVSVREWPVEARGLRHDRRWMLVDESGTFLSQRSDARMALIDVEFMDGGMLIGGELRVPLSPQEEECKVQVWNSVCHATRVSDEADRWFSERLGLSARLVYMPDHMRRPAGSPESLETDLVGFADSDPILVAGEASLADLNARLDCPVPILRFRPNVVLSGSPAFAEDEWSGIGIGRLSLRRTRRCGRCRVTTIDIETAEVSDEPLRTLARYRTFGKHACFGSYYAPETRATIAVGDDVQVIP